MKPYLIQGAKHTDERGTVSFVNDFKLDKIKRFYIIEHKAMDTIRAWQGHQKEQKWFYVISGSFKIVLLVPDNWENPAQDLPYQEFELRAGNSQVLAVPSGYVSGFRALEPGAKLIIYSDATLEESVADDFRYEKDRWYDWSSTQ